LLRAQLKKGGAAVEIRDGQIDDRPPRSRGRVIVKNGVEALKRS
jgi:hypothetical protein